MFEQIDSDKGKLIMLYLSKNSKATAQEIKEKLSIKLLEIYSVLQKLIEKNIVEKVDSETYKLKVDVSI